jgi:hypothetical protein
MQYNDWHFWWKLTNYRLLCSHTPSFQKRLDLTTLCKDFNSVLPSTYLATYWYHPSGVILTCFPPAMYCFLAGNVLLMLFECNIVSISFPRAMYCFFTGNLLLSLFEWCSYRFSAGNQFFAGNVLLSLFGCHTYWLSAGNVLLLCWQHTAIIVWV